MIRHIVMWKFKEGEDPTDFLNGLKALQGQIPQIRYMELHRSCVENADYDALLISDFDSLEDLNIYKKDPRHVAVSALCKKIRTDRSAIDFEV